MIGGVNMHKIAAVINSLNEAQNIQKYVDAFLIPLKDLAVNYNNTFSLNEIKQIKNLNRELFIILNKNIHNSELPLLEKTLKKLNDLNISGLIFYDIAIVNLKEKLNLKIPLVWNQEHLTTNYGTINYWYDKGVQMTYLSSELTKREVDEIRKNTKAKLFITVFGYLPMFTSKRHLVQNYLDTFNLKSKSHTSIKKEGKTYQITDSLLGTTVYSDYILNAVNEDFSNIDYLVFNSNLIDEKTFLEVLQNYHDGKPNKFNIETGFLYQETIYKVK